MIVLISFVLLGLQCFSNGEPSNKFEAISGCLQHNTNDSYYSAHPYFPTSGFRHRKITESGVQRMRFGVLGNNDGIFRLAPTKYPYNSIEMHEIVISGWSNTKIQVRRDTRTSPSVTANRVVLKSQSSIGMLSVLKPFMFTMAVHPGGRVQLTQDGDSIPFLDFSDPKLSSGYIGFCNWNVPVVFFYDCPPEVEEKSSFTKFWKRLENEVLEQAEYVRRV